MKEHIYISWRTYKRRNRWNWKDNDV